MILADSSVWIDHISNPIPLMEDLLEHIDLVIHPFVIGEISCGSLRFRRKTLDFLNNLPKVTVANHDEVVELIEKRRLMNKGIGWIDAHLLASTILSEELLWTRDKRLRAAAISLGIHFQQ